MTTDEINRYIHTEIIGKCWHDIQVSRTVPDGFAVKRCSICQATNFSTPLENPRYCSDESPRSLLNAVIAKFESSGNARRLAECLDSIPDKGTTVIWWPTAETFARACVEAWKAK